MRLIGTLLLIAIWTPNAIAANIWYLGVADTSDVDIGAAVQRDILAFQDLLASVDERSDWSVRRSVLVGGDVSRDAILESVAEILHDRPRPDVIIFYYSGHGAASPGQDPYPTLTLEGSDIRFSEIYASLSKANPRLLIVISDACNVPDRAPASYAVERTPASLSSDGLLTLLQQRGTFLATAASRGEYAYTGAEPYPSVFTKRLISVLKAESSNSVPSWFRVRGQLSNAIKVSFEDGEVVSQTPYVSWVPAP